jgi:hypothetical protein
MHISAYSRERSSAVPSNYLGDITDAAPEELRLSLELGTGIDVSFEGSVDDICANINHVWHDWLVLGSIPGNVPRLSELVPVGIFMVLMIDGGLSCSPFSVGIWNGRVLWENPSDVPEEQVWVVDQGLGLHSIVVHDYRSGELESSS